MFRWVIGGLIGGAIGIAIWTAIGYFAHYEIGWIACVVGFLVGVGVRIGDNDGIGPTLSQGIAGAAIAIGSIILAKFLIFVILTSGVDRAALKELSEKINFGEEGMIAAEASEIVSEMTARGVKINWPVGITEETAEAKADYPANIWSQATGNWKQLGAAEQNKRMQERVEFARMISQASATPSFTSSFSGWDLLWLGLAAATAFKVCVGVSDDD